MAVVLVGESSGRMVTRWTAALLLGFALGCLTAAIAAIVYYALAGQFSLIAVALGFFGPFILLGADIQHARRLPITELTPLDRPPA